MKSTLFAVGYGVLPALLVLPIPAAFAEEAAASLDSAKYAKQLADPVAALVSVPFQLNFDDNIGPTVVALKQQGPWTYGFLVNHIRSFAGDGDRQDVNSTFMQPFIGYTTATGWSFDLQTETTYDCENEQWNVPLVVLVSMVTSVGGQLVQFQGGPKYYAEHFDNGPEGVGFRLAMTLLFPK